MSKLKPLSPRNIERMRALGRIHNVLLSKVYDFLEPGVDSWEVEKFYESLLKKYKVKSACKGYQPDKSKAPFPTNICLGTNSDCVHTYPKKGKVLNDGDIVVIDTVITDGVVFTDAAVTKVVGRGSKKKFKLAATAREALQRGLQSVHADVRLGEVSFLIYQTVKENGFDVLREYGGHGIGTSMWQEPFIPNYGMPGEGPVLPKGITLAIEPLLVTGKHKVLEVDDWATTLADKGYFAQWEATVLVTNKGYEILVGYMVE